MMPAEVVSTMYLWTKSRRSVYLFAPHSCGTASTDSSPALHQRDPFLPSGTEIRFSDNENSSHRHSSAAHTRHSQATVLQAFACVSARRFPACSPVKSVKLLQQQQPYSLQTKSASILSRHLSPEQVELPWCQTAPQLRGLHLPVCEHHALMQTRIWIQTDTRTSPTHC